MELFYSQIKVVKQVLPMNECCKCKSKGGKFNEHGTLLVNTKVEYNLDAHNINSCCFTYRFSLNLPLMILLGKNFLNRQSRESFVLANNVSPLSFN